MQGQNIIDSISTERFKPYLLHCKNNSGKALRLYQKNVEVSQSFYAPLSVLEITLRNKIDQSFKNYFNNSDWLTNNLPPELLKQVVDIEIKLNRTNKNPTNSKILAELNFGFWTMLFNRHYAKYFWKPLHQIFVNIPSEKRKRKVVSSKLNHIRTLRNRIYHYEPVIWDINELKNNQNVIVELVNWMDKDTSAWLETFDNSISLLNKVD